MKTAVKMALTAAAAAALAAAIAAAEVFMMMRKKQEDKEKEGEDHPQYWENVGGRWVFWGKQGNKWTEETGWIDADVEIYPEEMREEWIEDLQRQSRPERSSRSSSRSRSRSTGSGDGGDGATHEMRTVMVDPNDNPHKDHKRKRDDSSRRNEASKRNDARRRSDARRRKGRSIRSHSSSKRSHSSSKRAQGPKLQEPRSEARSECR